MSTFTSSLQVQYQNNEYYDNNYHVIGRNESINVISWRQSVSAESESTPQN